MKFKIFNVEISISVLFCLLVTFLLIIDVKGIMIASLITVVVHELGHLVCMKKLNCFPKELKFTAYGVFIVSPAVYSNNKEKFLVALYGPLFNLIATIVFCFFFFWLNKNIFLYLTVSNFAFFTVNMIPINGLDGGTVFKLLLIKILGEQNGSKSFVILSLSFSAILVFLGFYLFVKSFSNPSLLLLGIYLFCLNIIKY